MSLAGRWFSPSQAGWCSHTEWRERRGGCCQQLVSCGIRGGSGQFRTPDPEGELLHPIPLGTKSDRRHLHSSNCDSTCTSVRRGEQQLLPWLSTMSWVMQGWNHGAQLHSADGTKGTEATSARGVTVSTRAALGWTMLGPLQTLPQPLPAASEQGAVTAPHSPHRDLPLLRALSIPSLGFPASPPGTAGLCSLFPHHAESRCLVCCTSAGFNCPCSVYKIGFTLLRTERKCFILLEGVLC